MERICDWCGRQAVTKTYRTLNVDTEFEQTSSYFECAECSQMATSDVVGRYTLLCTCPADDANYCDMFVVETAWLEQWLKRNGKTEEERNLQYFLDNHTWDETYIVYLSAKAEKKIVSEGVEV